MRTVGCFLRIFVLVPAILSCEATRAYYLAGSAGQPPCSGAPMYAASYTGSDTPAVLAPRTDLNKHLGFNPKRAVVLHSLAYARPLEKELAPFLTHDGVLVSLSETQLKSHSLFCLRCLLTV